VRQCSDCDTGDGGWPIRDRRLEAPPHPYHGDLRRQFEPSFLRRGMPPDHVAIRRHLTVSA
jgi:hypothetical protein